MTWAGGGRVAAWAAELEPWPARDMTRRTSRYFASRNGSTRDYGFKKSLDTIADEMRGEIWSREEFGGRVVAACIICSGAGAPL